MPELPEVETIKNQLAKNITYKKITEVKILRQSIFVTDSKAFENTICKKKIQSVQRRAKLLLFKIEDRWLITHLRMTGVYIYERQNTEQSTLNSKQTRFTIFFENGDRLIYQDQRALGRIYLFNEQKKEQFFASYGIEPFDQKFDLNYLIDRLKARKVNIKQFLLDQKEIVGIGNIYASEILYLANIHPLAVANEITKIKAKKLLASIKKILEAAIENNGTTFSDYRQTDGKKGSFQNFLKAYNHEKEACRKCSNPIVRLVIGQRSTYFCPECQKK